MTDGPLKRAFDLLDTDGVISRELITYRVRDGMVIKEVVNRKYNENNTSDYLDYSKSEPLTRKGPKTCGH